MTLFYAFIGSFILCVACLFALNPLAKRIGLTDKPDKRRQHKQITPLTGGIACGASFIAISFFYMPLPPYFVMAVGAVIALGVCDDFLDLRPLFKLIGQIAIVAFLVYHDILLITSLGTIGTEEIYLGHFSAPFTIIAIVGLINAINMIDGINGAAGGLFIVALAHLILLALWIAHPLSAELTFLITIALGAVAAFLTFNLADRSFLGDSGSMLLGLLLSYFLITASSPTQDIPFPTSLIPWLVALPVIETLTLAYRRIRQKRTPFSADRTHLHHLLQDKGLSPHQTLYVMIAGAVALIWIGFAIFISTPFLQGAIAGIVFIFLPVLYYRLLIRKLAH